MISAAVVPALIVVTLGLMRIVERKLDGRSPSKINDTLCSLQIQSTEIVVLLREIRDRLRDLAAGG